MGREPLGKYTYTYICVAEKSKWRCVCVRVLCSGVRYGEITGRGMCVCAGVGRDRKREREGEREVSGSARACAWHGFESARCALSLEQKNRAIAFSLYSLSLLRNFVDVRLE